MDNTITAQQYRNNQEMKRMQQAVTRDQYSAYKHPQEAQMVHPGSQVQSQILRSLDLTINIENVENIQSNGTKVGMKASFLPFNILDRR